MTVFVAGVHGVGKTNLCKQLVGKIDFFYVSASTLISKQLDKAKFDNNKLVDDVSKNQAILISELKKLRKSHEHILLDGHLALIDKNKEIIKLKPSLFKDLNINSIILVEDGVAQIAERLKKRDAIIWDQNVISELMKAEREVAYQINLETSIPIKITSPELSSDIYSYLKEIGIAVKTSHQPH